MPSAPTASGSSSLPDEIVQSIAISNAKAIGEQPAILANLALANQILNTNLQQQMFISNQQAMNQIVMATMAKCVTLIVGDDGKSTSAASVKELLDVLKTLQAKPVNPTG
jgi:hypothetical protein